MSDREAIVAFLRRETRLYALADLIEAGAHHFTKTALATWCDDYSAKYRDGEIGHLKTLSYPRTK